MNIGIKTISGMIRDNDFVPVPSRKTIENHNMFKEYILAYIDDPALAYFLHIQGSGINNASFWRDDGS